MSRSNDPALTYASYLKVDELLALQQPKSSAPEHDEMLFIVIHQVYELWFKELLHELDHVRTLLESHHAHRAQHTLKRILTILKVMVAQLDILETMTPLEFSTFRARLEAARFQSDQFRQLEFALGQKAPQAVEPSADVQTVLIDVYRRDPRNAELCERFVDLDEGMQEWRYRHVKMVERTIGTRRGTGGSAGAAYLRGTLGHASFLDLWEIRASL